MATECKAGLDLIGAHKPRDIFYHHHCHCKHSSVILIYIYILSIRIVCYSPLKLTE